MHADQDKFENVVVRTGHRDQQAGRHPFAKTCQKSTTNYLDRYQINQLLPDVVLEGQVGRTARPKVERAPAVNAGAAGVAVSRAAANTRNKRTKRKVLLDVPLRTMIDVFGLDCRNFRALVEKGTFITLSPKNAVGRAKCWMNILRRDWDRWRHLMERQQQP